MEKVTKNTPHGTVELRAENADALAYVMTAVSSAPELLIALEGFTTRLGRNSTAMANYGDLVRIAREAIANAKGIKS